jgi:hypothetical protein
MMLQHNILCIFNHLTPDFKGSNQPEWLNNHEQVMKRFFIFLLGLMLGVSGCATNGPMVAVYDNGGGFAYGGHYVAFYTSGKFESQDYTDMGPQATDSGTYEKFDSTFVLTSPKGQKIYHVVNAGKFEYLLDDATYREYVRTKDAEKLHQQMRRDLGGVPR